MNRFKIHFFQLSSLLGACLLVTSALASGGYKDAESDQVRSNFQSVSPFEICENDNCDGGGIDFTQHIENDGFRLVPTDAVIKYYHLEDFSDKLSPALEDAFDAFIFVNAAEGKVSKCSGNNDGGPLAIPPQFGRIVWKKDTRPGHPVFSRDVDNKITGILPGTTQIVMGLDDSFAAASGHIQASVLKYLSNHTEQNYFPVSTGTFGNIAHTSTPSGIFGIDYNYTSYYHGRNGLNDPFEHMPNTLLADARYGDNYQNRKFAIGIHGTPEIFVACKETMPTGLVINPDCPPCPISADADITQIPPNCMKKNNESTLGLKRDSAGCMRTFTPTSKVISDWAWKYLKSSQVPVMDPNNNIPGPEVPKKRATDFKMLIIPFDGYQIPICT